MRPQHPPQAKGPKSPKDRAIAEIEMLMKELGRAVIVEMRGGRWEADSSGLHRPGRTLSDPWEGIPMGDLALEEACRIRTAYRMAKPLEPVPAEEIAKDEAFWEELYDHADNPAMLAALKHVRGKLTRGESLV